MFYKSEDVFFLDRFKSFIHKEAKVDGIKAAYVGVSSIDDPEVLKELLKKTALNF